MKIIGIGPGLYIGGGGPVLKHLCSNSAILLYVTAHTNSANAIHCFAVCDSYLSVCLYML